MRRTQSITVILLIINISIYLFITVATIGRGDLQTVIYYYGGISQWALNRGLVYTIISALFLHGSFLHIAFNMFALYQLGRLVEGVYGQKKFLIFYFGTGLVGNLSAAFFSPPTVPTIGSSSAIFGLVGVLFILGFRKDTPTILQSVTGLSLLPIIIINLIFGFTAQNISNSAHIGGLLCGIALGWFIGPGYSGFRRRHTSTRVREKSPQAVAREILIKYANVFNSLNKEEGEERNVRIAQLRSELSNLNDYDLAYKVLKELYRRDMITTSEFDKVRKLI
ncbi:MAG: rhomboid family intramembrane serine protease [Kosmotogaceae bacterium]